MVTGSSEKGASGGSQAPRGAAPADLIVYWRALAKRKWLILGVAIAAAGIVAAVVNALTPVYQSTATVLIPAHGAAPAAGETGTGAAQQSGRDQAPPEALRASQLAVKLIDKLDLTRHPQFDPRQAPPSALTSVRRWLGATPDSRSGTDDDVYKHVVRSLVAGMTIEPVRRSQFVRVSFESADPMTASIIANAIAETYIESDFEARQQITSRRIDSSPEGVDGLKQNLERSERDLQQQREQARGSEGRGTGPARATRHVEDLTARLTAARQQRLAAESAYRQVSAAKERPEALPAVMSNPLVQQLREQESQADKRVNELSARFGPEHPRMVQAQAELKVARDAMRRQVETVVASLGHELELARNNETALERALAETKSASKEPVVRNDTQLASLERSVAASRQAYELALTRMKDVQRPDVQPPLIGRIADPAKPAQEPARPRKAQLIAIAFVLGILAAALIAFILEHLENTIESSDDVEQKLGYPMLAMLPRLKGDEAKRVGRQYLEDPQSIFSECIRSARTGILLGRKGSPQMSVLVTSSVPGEGKTAIAVNLALAHAQTRRVLLVDADLRRPAVTATLGVDPAKPGLTDLWSGRAKFAECLQRVEGSSLYVLASGPVPLNPLEMILSERFEQLMRGLAGTCDVLVVDSPPVHPVTDALVLAKMASGVLFIIKAGATPYPLAQQCIRALEQADARLVGVALNQLDFKRAERYYGSYAGGYYQYGTDPARTGARAAKARKRKEPVAALPG